jgi:flagellar motor switch protein FliM
MLGGRGHSVKLERYLTEIEIALLEDIIMIVLEEWCHQWKHEKELHPQVIGHENNGRFLQTSPKDAIILALTLEANFGDCSEQLQIGVPYYTIEPMVRAMQVRRQKDATPGSVSLKAEWKPAYEHIAIPARAEWDAFDISLREISHLHVGDVIEMPAGILDETRISLNGTPKFIGTVGLDSDRVAVKLTKKIPTEQSLPPRNHGR